MRIVVVGDSMLDRDVTGDARRLSPEAPVPVVEGVTEQTRPGGAGLAAALAARDGCDVVLVTAIGRDGPGMLLRAALAEAGVEVVDVGLVGPTPEKVRVRAGGRTVVRYDRGDRGACAAGSLTARARAALRMASAVLVSDYGYGLTADPLLGEAVGGPAPVIWDPHPRGASPVPGSALVVPNAAEAELMVPDVVGTTLTAVGARARALAERLRARAVCVTDGPRGAVMSVDGGPPMVFPTEAEAGDTCGAGDRFASAVAVALADGMPVTHAVGRAIARASHFVRGAADAEQQATVAGDAAAVTDAIRTRGGRIVATGGCFDLLHAGHVQMLERARRLGDALVVLLNSDHSVRRLKGPQRPLVPESDRAAVLLGLGCVDAVEIFDEDTPCTALRRLRPDVFVKGGDYRDAEIPERVLMEEMGGEFLVVPFLEGRSTSRLIDEARRHAS